MGASSSGTTRLNWNASNVASGVYVYVLSVGEVTLTSKVTLLK